METALHILNLWAMKAALITGLCWFCILAAGSRTQAQDVPRYKVDRSWPKPLPNNRALGQIGGMAADKNDHIWVVHRPRTVVPPKADAAQTTDSSKCCVAAPSVLEFDTAGNLIKSWGGPDWVPDWSVQEHGMFVETDGSVWTGGNGPQGKGTTDRIEFKFTNDGKLLMKIGRRSDEPQNNADTTVLGGPAGAEVDEAAHEVYIADGYMNKRVVVYDSKTGVFKRGWGAYGIPLDQIDNSILPAYDSAIGAGKQFRWPVHCVHISVDGLVYVCDRSGDRVQVFTKAGKFVKEFLVHPETLGTGSVGTLAFTSDKMQKYLLIGDDENDVVWIVNRSDGSAADSFGQKGTGPGQFQGLHAMAIDSHGNVYTGENGGKRIQKFVLENSEGNH